jgi:SAM-dependent methyltransferase
MSTILANRSIHIPYNVDPSTNKGHYYEWMWKKIGLDLLANEQLATKNWSMLDFGCGRGESMQIAREMGMSPVGTDTDPECVRLGSSYGPTYLLNALDPLRQFGEKSFDLVVCMHVLEHVPNPKETLVALCKIARKRVIVAVPNLGVFGDLLRPNRWVGPINEGHLQSWNHSHFKNLAENHCGLRILQWGFDAVRIPPFTSWIQRFLGNKAAIFVEMSVLRRIYPYACLSVIALMEPLHLKSSVETASIGSQ